jgi:hypothetical protein
MLFLFEAGFFVLALAAFALAEFWGKFQALAVWSGLTLASLVVDHATRARLTRTPPADQTEARWQRDLIDGWRHLNRLLLLGLAGLAGWWWLSGR